MQKNATMQHISRRGMMIYGASTAVLSLLGLQMVNLQVFQAKDMLELAQKNRIDWKILLPKRGFIFDRQQQVIAESAVEYDLYLRSRLDDMDVPQIERLLEIISLSPQEYSLYQDMILSNVTRPLLLRRNVQRDMLIMLEFNLSRLPDYLLQQQLRRRYTWGIDLAPISGYTGRPDLNEREGKNFELLDEFRIGKSGIEQYYEHHLRGRPGRAAMEVDVRGKQLGELKREESLTGRDVHLHIHAGVQRQLMSLLRRHRSASVVVVDAHSGSVLALGSHPFYDANEMREPISNTRWNELLHDPLKPMTNKAISGLYAPGSALKPFVAMAALQAGLTGEQSYFCAGHIQLGNTQFHCWKRHGHGSITMRDAIAQSCNVWFYQVAQQLGIDRIATTLRQFGFGQTTGIDLQHEKAGLVPDSVWKRRQFNQPFYQGETVVHAIGQGFLQVTPLQLARAYAALINGGRLIEPKIFDFAKQQGSEHNDVFNQVLADLSQQPPALINANPAFDANHLALVQAALVGAVNDPRGTAWRARLTQDSDGFLMAGKTGTAQVRQITPEEREQGISQEDIAWPLRDHAIFASFAPVDQPRYVVVALVEHGISGARTAAPLVKAVYQTLSAEGLIA